MNNDLISRSALKEKVDSVQYTKEFCIEHQIDYSISMQMLGLVIDNAPTIEINEITQDLIDKVNVNVGLAQPIKDERPQGEITNEDIDMRSYMLGYLKGCEDSLKKFNELNKPQFSMPLRKQYMKGGAE